MVSEIRAGGASIFVMLEDGADAERVMDEIRSAIDSINTLPADLKQPTIVQFRDAGDDMEIGFFGSNRNRNYLNPHRKFARGYSLCRASVRSNLKVLANQRLPLPFHPNCYVYMT